MNPWTYRFCRVVMLLDRIPRYGRYYRLERIPDHEPGDVSWKTHAAEWRWSKRGRWGMNLLDMMGLMWPFIDEGVRRHDAATRPAPGRTDHRD